MPAMTHQESHIFWGNLPITSILGHDGRKKAFLSSPTWKKNKVSDDPSAKLKEFLSLNKATELFEGLAKIAKEQLAPNYHNHLCKEQDSSN